MNRPEAGKEACKPAPAELKPDTKVTTGGRNPHAHHGYVNTPVYRASTQLYRTAEDYLVHNGPYFYGRLGTPTSEALETAIRALRCCLRGWRRSRPRCLRCSSPAIIC